MEPSQEERISMVIEQRHSRSNKEQSTEIEKMALLLHQVLGAVERLTQEVNELNAEVKDLKCDVAYLSEANARMGQSLPASDGLEEEVRYDAELSDELARELLDGLIHLSKDAAPPAESSAPEEDTARKSVRLRKISFKGLQPK